MVCYRSLGSFKNLYIFIANFIHGVVVSLVLPLAGAASTLSAFAVCLSPRCYPIGKICTS